MRPAVVIDDDIKRLKRIKHEERASALPLGTAAPELRKIDCARQPRRDARPARNVVSERTSRLLKNSLPICRCMIPWGGDRGWRCAVTTRFVAAFSAI